MKHLAIAFYLFTGLYIAFLLIGFLLLMYRCNIHKSVKSYFTKDFSALMKFLATGN